MNSLQFEEQALILIPNDDGSFQWKKISDCIWSTMDFRLQNKTYISSFYSKNPHLSHFFQNILEVKDAGLGDYLEELKSLQKHNAFDLHILQRTKDVYTKIQELMGPGEKM